MKLRTSYFNSTVLFKNITRFCPVWALYSVGLLMVYLFAAIPGVGDFFFSIYAQPASLGVYNMIYAGICAAVLYTDLFRTRSCYALHAMPMRRAGWFLTNTVSGILFSLIPTSIFSIALMPLLGKHWTLALLCGGASLLQYLFFFGLASFSVMCAGKKFGMFVTFGLLIFFSTIAYGFINLWYSPVMPGIVLDETIVNTVRELLSPFSLLIRSDFASVDYNYSTYALRYDGLVMEGCIIHLIVGACGIGLLGLALLIYRRRNLENAGDFLSFGPIKPLFLLTYTLSVTAVFYLIGQWIGGFIGFAVGYFTGLMLLRRTVRVFQFKRFLVLVGLIVLLVSSIGLIKLDLFGIVRYTPEAQQVKSVSVTPGDHYGEDEYITYTDPADIEAVIDMHEALQKMEQPDIYDYTATSFRLTYQLNNGKTVLREHLVCLNEDTDPAINRVTSSWKYVLRANSQSDLIADIFRMEIDFFNDSRDEMVFVNDDYAEKLLIDAIIRDCEEGTMNTSRDYYYDYYEDTNPDLPYVRIRLKLDSSLDEQYVWVYPKNSHTYAALNMLYELYTTGASHV